MFHSRSVREPDLHKKNVEDYPRLDLTQAATWKYPTNFEVRGYQVAISEQALFRNTLVCLPTGLGKTLVAAVVMHAYYVWFPTGAVIFMAPTKPLVTQQLEACHSVMGTPVQHTAHLEGSITPEKRADFWVSRRVFFCTPQTLLNDLRAGRLNPRSVVCLVFDEAHKATGGYAYTLVIKELENANARFRVLALSATPGADLRKVQEVVRNLRIEHMEVRHENDPELERFRHDRLVETVAVSEGGHASMLKELDMELLNELMRPVVLQLVAHGMLSSDSPQNVNMFAVEEALRRLNQMERGQDGGGARSPAFVQQIKTLISQMSATLDCRRALFEAGLAGLLSLMAKPEQRALACLPRFQKLEQTLRRTQNDYSRLEKRAPKVAKLKELLAEHFARFGRAAQSTRVIVFANLRATVHEIVSELQGTEGVRVKEFVGQATKAAVDGLDAVRGLNQQEQQQVLQAFNRGDYNVLAATSIAEEGLDIAEVDLIVFFDVSASPIRLVQRMGRTGRKRTGRIIMLLQGAAEVDKYEQSQRTSAGISAALKNVKDKIKMFPAPDFPVWPTELPKARMVQEHIEVSEFHLSQVGGHFSRPQRTQVPVQPEPVESGGIRDYFQAAASNTSWDSWGQHAENFLQRQQQRTEELEQIDQQSLPYEDLSDAVEGCHDSLDASVPSSWHDDVVEVTPWRPEAISRATVDVCEMCARSFTSKVSELICASCTAVCDESGRWAQNADQISAVGSVCNITSATAAIPPIAMASAQALCPANHNTDPLSLYRSMKMQYQPNMAPQLFRPQQSRLLQPDFGIIAIGTSAHSDNINVSLQYKSAPALTPCLQSEQKTLPRHETLLMSSQLNALHTSAPSARTGAPRTFFLPSSQSSDEDENEEVFDYMAFEQANSSEAGSTGLTSLIPHSNEAPFSPESPHLNKEREVLSISCAQKCAAPAGMAIQEHIDKLPLHQSTEVVRVSCVGGLKGFVLPDSQGEEDEDQEDYSNSFYKHDIESSAYSGHEGGKAFDDESTLHSDPESQCGERTQHADDASYVDLQYTQTESPSPPPTVIRNGANMRELPIVKFDFNVEFSGGEDSAIHSDTETAHDDAVKASLFSLDSSPILSPAVAWATDFREGGKAPILDLVASPSVKPQWESSPPLPMGAPTTRNSANRSRLTQHAPGTSFFSTVVSSPLSLVIKPSRANADKSSLQPVRSVVNSDSSFSKDLLNITNFTPGPKNDTGNSLTESQEDSPCVMCLARDPSNDPMVYCDGPCGQCVHLGCYGLKAVPAGNFYCEACDPEHQRHFPRPRCALCFREDGFMTCTLDNQFTHPVCALWIQELPVDEYGHATNLRALDPDRKALRCEICHKKGGGCLQCAYGNCLHAVHPHCAYAAHQQMTVRADTTGRQYALYCKEHEKTVVSDDTLYAALLPLMTPGDSAALVGAARVRSPAEADTMLLLDSGEKPNDAPARQRLRRVRDLKSRSKKSHCAEASDKVAEESRRQVKKRQRQAAAQQARQFFDIEAEVSGSASEDECDDDSLQSQQLSGSFINDGEYTQHSRRDSFDGGSPSSVSSHGNRKSKGKSNTDGMTLYYRVNRGLDTQSQLAGSGESQGLRLGFRGAEKGLPHLERFLRKLRARQNGKNSSEDADMEIGDTQASADENLNDSEFARSEGCEHSTEFEKHDESEKSEELKDEESFAEDVVKAKISVPECASQKAKSTSRWNEFSDEDAGVWVGSKIDEKRSSAIVSRAPRTTAIMDASNYSSGVFSAASGFESHSAANFTGQIQRRSALHSDPASGALNSTTNLIPKRRLPLQATANNSPKKKSRPSLSADFLKESSLMASDLPPSASSVSEIDLTDEW